MIWNVCLIAAILLTLLALLGSILLGVKRYKRGRFLTPLNLLFGGMFLAVLTAMIPYYAEKIGTMNFAGAVKTFLLSAHNTFQVFTIDVDREIILEGVQGKIAGAYTFYLSAAYVISPILTFGFLISFFKNVSAHMRYLFQFFGDVYVFSELNERSVTLAKDLKKNHRHSVIVFTDVFEENSERSYELSEQAREVGAICFKKDITSVRFQRHYGKSKIVFFTIGEDEAENIEQSLRLIAGYKERANTELYVFSIRVDSELLLTGTDKGVMKVRRVNDVQSRINRLLYDEAHRKDEDGGHRIFGKALPAPDGKKNISAIVVGMGRHGSEMIKTLAWYCQIDGYRIRIDAFDRDPLAREKFSALCPELMSPDYNGVFIPGESEYTILIHSGIDASTKSFSDMISGLKETTYVFICLGSDEENIKTAVNMRMLFERCGAKPVIQAVVYGSDEKEALTGIKNYRGQSYDIDFIGDLRSSYSESVIIGSELENEALQRHLKWGKEEEFWQYEYNYRSSVASALHMHARICCGIPGADKKEEDLTEEERAVIEPLEHRRWNAYMRAEGYIYSGSKDRLSRNDLGKMHHDLVDFASLPDEIKRMDSRVGSK